MRLWDERTFSFYSISSPSHSLSLSLCLCFHLTLSDSCFRTSYCRGAEVSFLSRFLLISLNFGMDGEWLDRPACNRPHHPPSPRALASKQTHRNEQIAAAKCINLNLTRKSVFALWGTFLFCHYSPHHAYCDILIFIRFIWPVCIFDSIFSRLK